MPSTYPGAVDDFDEPSAPTTTALGSAGDSAPARKHSESHRDIGDAVVATQTELDAHKASSDPHPNYALDTDLATHEAATDPHTGYQKESEKGAANGYAGLDGGGTVLIAQLPSSLATDAELAAAAALLATKTDPDGLGIPFTVDPRVASSTGSPLTVSNRCFYGRVRGSGSTTKLAVHVVASSGNIALAHYANSGTGRSAVPAGRQRTSGSVACPAIGYAEVSIGSAITVVTGEWFALAADNTTATFARTSAVLTSQIAKGLTAHEDAFPPPDPATPLVTTVNSFVIVGVP